jgi:transcriptional regulator with XRE-family HTH domain
MTLGARIRRYREANNMTVRQLANEAGMSHSSLTRLELGSTRGANSENLIALARALRVSVDELVRPGEEVTAAPAGSLSLETYPYPAYAVRDGHIVAVNAELLQLVGWGEAELVGAVPMQARFRYPHSPYQDTDLLITVQGDIHVHHRVRPASLPDGTAVHLVHLCTVQAIREAGASLKTLIESSSPDLARGLGWGCLFMRRFGMRGVSIWVIDPATGAGWAEINNQLHTAPPLEAWHLDQLRRCYELAEPCEYFLPGVREDGTPWPLGFPRRALSLRIGSEVICFGWAGDLTLSGFLELAQDTALSLASLPRP